MEKSELLPPPEGPATKTMRGAGIGTAALLLDAGIWVEHIGRRVCPNQVAIAIDDSTVLEFPNLLGCPLATLGHQGGIKCLPLPRVIKIQVRVVQRILGRRHFQFQYAPVTKGDARGVGSAI